MAKNYWEKLKDPRWQRKRLEALQRAGFACEACHDTEQTLHVHHKAYFKGREPWEYEDEQLAVLCEDCHQAHHESEDHYKLVGSFLPMDGVACRDVVADLVAGYAELPGRSIDPIAFYSGSIARNLFIGQNIYDLLAVSSAAWEDPAGLFAAIKQWISARKQGD